MISNKKIILVFLTIAFNSIYCIAQSKMINGIEIKVPEELVYQDDIKSFHLWSNSKKDKVFILQYFKSSKSDYETRKAPELDTETTAFIETTTIDILNNKYDIQINYNEEKGSIVASTLAYRDGYMYNIIYGFPLLEENLDNFAIELIDKSVYFIKMILTS